MRRLILLALIGGSALAMAAPAGAATPSLKAQFTPLNAQIVKIGSDIATDVNGADKETDAQLAKQFAGLARRTSAASVKVGKLKGATGSTLTAQRQLQLALALGATDLAKIYGAAVEHSAAKAKAATIALFKDSAPIKSTRLAFAKLVGVKASG
ncbi:MAG TPA: hypothetical protein VGF46_09580 [Gaiellales bacterium]